MHYGNNNDLSLILWRSAARTLGRLEEWESWKYEKRIGHTTFRSPKPFDEKLLTRTKQLQEAIRFRINGHGLKTDKGSGIKRIGSWRIHQHAVAQILETISKIETQAPEGASFNHKPYYSHDKHVVNCIFTPEKILLFIVRNWRNPLHSSQIPSIVEALNEIETRIRSRHPDKKISKVLFAPSLEGNGHGTLDLAVNEDIYFYDLPYVNPPDLNKEVKLAKFVDVDHYYGGPQNHHFNHGTIQRLFSYLWKFLLRRLVKKNKKHTNQDQQQVTPSKTRVKSISSLSLFPMKNLQDYLKRRLNQGDRSLEPSRDVEAQPESMFSPSGKGPPKPETRPLEAKSRPLEVKKPTKIVVEVEDSSLRARFSVMKRLRGRQYYLRQSWSYVEGPFFYRLVEYEGGIKKRIKVSLDGLRSLYGEKYMLSHAVYALKQMNPRNPLVKAARARALNSYLSRLRLIQTVSGAA